LEGLDQRLVALREDRGRYDDAIRLRELGSLSPLAVTRSLCPTCEQALPPTLLGSDIGPVMTLEDNRALIDEELKTFGAMKTDAEQVLGASRQRLKALRTELDDTRRTIRSLKSTLLQDARAPSRAAIARQVRLEDRIERLEALDEDLAGLDARLAELAAAHQQVSAALARLGGSIGASDSDREKVRAFSELIREQLGEYGFTSVPADQVELTPDTYLPMRNDALLRPDELSASDRVRLVWAYLIGLMEMARRFETAHPGLLVFDEPGQQDISDNSLRALFRRLATAKQSGQQAIVATSKRPDLVREFAIGTASAVREVEGYVLKPEANHGGDEAVAA
jgi:hypothetical protein